jgi:hypothetical protein
VKPRQFMTVGAAVVALAVSAAVPASAAPANATAPAAASARSNCVGYPTYDIGWLHYRLHIDAATLSGMFGMPLQEIYLHLAIYAMNCGPEIEDPTRSGARTAGK